MDIQVASNFERALFEASGRNAATVRRYMDGLKQSGARDHRDRDDVPDGDVAGAGDPSAVWPCVARKILS